ncbi:MAG: hypothetical protein KDB07_02970 [Planctomycetes bacterium]|nr:hypothetical protein [Planctomycetota bacterium]
MSNFSTVIGLIKKKAVYTQVIQHLSQFVPTDVQPERDVVITASYADVTVRVDADTIEAVKAELQKSLDAVVTKLEEISDERS